MNNREVSVGHVEHGRALKEHHDNGIVHYYPSFKDEQDDDEIDLRELWNTLLRRKGLIIAVALSVFLITALATILMTPIYRSSVTVQINPEDSGRVLQYDVASQEQSFNAKDFYQTQYELLKSKALANQVIDELNLESYLGGAKLAKPFFEETLESITGWFSDIKGEDESETVPVILGEASLADKFLTDLTVEPVKNSRIVTIHYESKNPQLATSVANTVAEKYIRMNLDRRVDAASYAEKFLKEQLVQAKSKLQESEAELVKYAKLKDIISTDDKQTLDSQTITELNKALTEARKKRIEVESNYEQLKSASSLTRIQENTVVQELKKTKARMEGDYQQKLGIYKPAYPEMLQLKQQINEIEQQIKNEISNETNALKADYLAAKDKEKELESELNKQKELFLILKDKSIKYNTLSREVETNRELYKGLLQRLKEVGVAGSVGTNNITVVDRATLPTGKFKPNTKLNLALGLVLGLFVGVVAAFLLEFIHNTVTTAGEIESLLNTTVLGTIPREKNTKNLAMLAAHDPQSALSESLRSLRTHLIFSTSHGLPKSLSITSAMPSEGKSSVISNLAISLCQAGKSVLLIDCDLRKPVQHKQFKLDNTIGMSDYLTGQKSEDQITQPTEVDGLFVIPSGPIPPTPVELLSGDRFSELLKKAHERFDIVLVDSPPIIGLSDALVIAQQVEVTLFTVAFNQTRKDAIRETYKRMKQSGANIVGAVFSKVKQSSGGSYAYYYYYQDDKKKLTKS
jgi:succinoglycan biosynthesis transport protein ExoP